MSNGLALCFGRFLLGFFRLFNNNLTFYHGNNRLWSLWLLRLFLGLLNRLINSNFTFYHRNNRLWSLWHLRLLLGFLNRIINNNLAFYHGNNRHWSLLLSWLFWCHAFGRLWRDWL